MTVNKSYVVINNSALWPALALCLFCITRARDQPCCRFIYTVCWFVVLRDKDLNPQAVSGRSQGNYKDDPDLTTQLHQTLGDFEEDLKSTFASEYGFTDNHEEFLFLIYHHSS